MEWLTDIDWRALLVPDTSPFEIVLRGSIIYLAAFIFLRVFKREAGTMGITDLIVVVFLADAAQNAMSADYKSVPDGALLMLVIVFWAYALDRLAYHVPALGRLMKPAALPLIRNGRLERRNMRREYITEEELRSQLRLQGVEEPGQVKRAFMEPDGRISVIPYEGDEQEAPDKKVA